MMKRVGVPFPTPDRIEDAPGGRGLCPGTRPSICATPWAVWCAGDSGVVSPTRCVTAQGWVWCDARVWSSARAFDLLHSSVLRFGEHNTERKGRLVSVTALVAEQNHNTTITKQGQEKKEQQNAQRCLDKSHWDWRNWPSNFIVHSQARDIESC